MIAIEISQRKKIHSSHQDGNSAIFFCIFWQKETGRLETPWQSEAPGAEAGEGSVGKRTALWQRVRGQHVSLYQVANQPQLTLVLGVLELPLWAMPRHVIHAQSYREDIDIRHTEFIRGILKRGKGGKKT